MPDASDLVKSMKRAAAEAVEASKPVNVCFGEVATTSPLKISIDQKLVLGESQLVLTRNVTDFVTMVTVNWESESALSTHTHALTGNTSDGGDPTHNHELTGETKATNLKHTHDIVGTKQIMIHNGLGAGDKVILIRQQDGQKYIVVDRIGGV